MSNAPIATPTEVRVLVAVVSHGHSKTLENLSLAVAELLRAANFHIVRSVVAQGEATYVQQLISNVSNENEADAIVMVGGTGFGPRDNACEAINGFVERRIEGFAEGFRELLRREFDRGALAMLSRAAAGVYNRCLVFALTGRPAEVTRAVEMLVVPALPVAVALATGRARAYDPHA